MTTEMLPSRGCCGMNRFKVAHILLR